MRKKFTSLFVGLIMVFTMTYTAMATEAVTELSGGDVSDIPETVLLAAEIPDEDTGEDANKYELTVSNGESVWK